MMHGHATFIHLDLVSLVFFASKCISRYLQVTRQNRFIQAITRWVLQESHVLRVLSKKHYRIGTNESRTQYHVRDWFHYEITIEEYANDSWRPLMADDVQLEVIMLDPHIRTTLINRNGTFIGDFMLPDRFGAFKLRVDYNRRGYSYVDEVDMISIRPPLHNEYERFVPAAYPYYVASFSMMFTLFLFSWVFLYHRESPASIKPKSS
jgi:oligosaccharyltransferase complex subunit beta